jgi:hypothetical protein
LLQGFRNDKDYQTAKSLLEGLEPAQYALLNWRSSPRRLIGYSEKRHPPVRKTINGIIVTFCIENRMPPLFSNRDFVSYVENLRLIDAANLF